MHEPGLVPAREGGSGAAERRIEWTGERCVPWAPDHQVVYEHLHRYYFARRFCEGRRVLDLACGEGYGSAILAEVASEVVGVDIDAPTVEHAIATYPRENLRFVEAPMLATDAYAGEPYDVVVCFEAIEHIAEHEELLAAIKSVLTPSGVALISTPDRTVYSEAADYHNPFHVRELSRDELCDLLISQFHHVSILGQRTMVGSRIDSFGDGKHEADEVFFVAPQGDTWVQRGPEDVPYLIAVASDVDQAVPEGSSLIDLELRALRSLAQQLEDAQVASPQEVAELRASVGTMARELEELRGDRSRLEAQHYANDAQIGALEASVREVVRSANEERERAQVALDELAAARDHLAVQLELEQQNVQSLATAVEAMRTSRGWRIMEALRGIRSHARSLTGLVAPRSGGSVEAPPPPP